MRNPAALAAVVVAALCATLCAGCIAIPIGGGSSSVVSGGGQVPGHGGSEESTPPMPTVGSQYEVGSWQVVVLSAVLSKKGPGGMAAGKGKRFLLVETEFRNVELGGALLVHPRDAKLEDPAGRQFKEVGTASGFNGHGMRVISAGMGGWTVFAYKVPADAADYVFTFSPKTEGAPVELKWKVP